MSSPLTPAERMAHARAAMRVKYLDEARDQFARLGVTPTPEQVEQAGDLLLKKAQQDRMAPARASRHIDAVEQKRVRNLDWGIRQVLHAADQLTTWDPATPDHLHTKVAFMALGDEVASPDGFNRKRLLKRLDALVAHVREQAAQRSVQLDRSLREPVDWDSLPSLDDIAESLGEPTWSGLSSKLVEHLDGLTDESSSE